MTNAYAPSIIPGKLLYFMGGYIDNGADLSYNSEKRFVDRTFCSRAYIGSTDLPYPAVNSSFQVGWHPPVEIINKHFFPWMQNPSQWWTPDRLLNFASCAGSLSPVEVDGRFIACLTATINDPNCCTGEHKGFNVYGSCKSPWSFDVMYWASSKDGENWTLERDPFRVPAQLDPSTSMALDCSALWYYPNTLPDSDPAADRNPSAVTGGTKGLTACSMLLADDGYLYIAIKFWGIVGVKNAMVRVKYNSSESAGHRFDFEIADTEPFGLWRPMKEGRLPRWLNDSARGQIFGSDFNQIAHTSKVPGQKYVATIVGKFDPAGSDAQLRLNFSNDLLRWTTPDGKYESVPVINAPASVMNPIYYEDGGQARIMWSEKIPDCTADPYDGLYLVEADLTIA